MKEWECVELNNHKDIGKTVQEWQKAGWRLHTYTASVIVLSMHSEIRHYLLFERGE